MGCFKKIIHLAILVLAITGFLSLGGSDFIKTHFGDFFSPSQEKMKEKAKNIVDLSAVSDEYEIAKTANFMGYKGVLAEHKASGQKFAILQPKDPKILTKKDFATKEVDKKIDELSNKFKKSYVHLENIEITGRGSIKALKQTIPYVRFEADAVNLPVQGVQGIVAVANGADNNSQIIISYAPHKKYSQIITEEFVRKIKW